MARMVWGAMAGFMFASAGLAQMSPRQIYLIYAGEVPQPLISGTLWLYSYSWYGLRDFKLASIDNGRVVVPLDSELLRQEVQPHPNTKTYLLAIQVGEQVWYRSPDIPADRFWNDLKGAVSTLGRTAELPSGEVQLVLPPVVKRRITLLYSDGRPRINADVSVSEYVSEYNHCGVHQGLPLGKYRTDTKGSIEVMAPLVPLDVDQVYFEKVGGGLVGTYEFHLGIKTGNMAAIVLKKKWEIERFAGELRVVTRSGTPRPNVHVWGMWHTATCGGGEEYGTTDSVGRARINLDATTYAVSLSTGAYGNKGENRDLTEAELRELFAKRRLTIVW